MVQVILAMAYVLAESGWSFEIKNISASTSSLARGLLRLQMRKTRLYEADVGTLALKRSFLTSTLQYPPCLLVWSYNNRIFVRFQNIFLTAVYGRCVL